MKFAKDKWHHTRVVNAHRVFRALCFLSFVVFTTMFWGCAPQTTTEIQEWGIVGYEEVYNTTQIIDPNGAIVDESRTLAGVNPVYGYYTQEVLVDPETRNSHDVLSKIIGGAVYGAGVYVLLKCLK